MAGSGGGRWRRRRWKNEGFDEGRGGRTDFYRRKRWKNRFLPEEEVEEQIFAEGRGEKTSILIKIEVKE